MLPILLAIALQIEVPQEVQKGTIAAPSTLQITLTHPKDYKFLPGSLTQSLVQQDSPLPPPFLVLNETTSATTGQDPIQQLVTFNIQPLKTGPISLFLQAEFTNDKGDILTTYALPIQFDIHPATVETPLLPPPYTPGGEKEHMEYTTKVNELKKRLSPQYAQNIRETLESRSIPWGEIIVSLLLAVATVWFTLKKVMSPHQKGKVIVTRYGMLRTLRRMSEEQNTPPEQFYGILEDQLKKYLKIPQTLTIEETINHLKNQHTIDPARLSAFRELFNLCEQSKFWPHSQDNSTYPKAISLTEEILK